AWAIKMKVFMQAQGVWEAVEPKKTGDAVDVKMDKMALAASIKGFQRICCCRWLKRKQQRKPGPR
nr:eukaryotic translation initiation factor 3 subunit C-like [Tanacetum cinerariifolium]